MIVFTRTKRQSQRIADDLAERGFAAAPLHGDMAQIAREKALAKFREDKLKVLVCTDVAARGIDVAACPTSSTTPAPRTTRPTSTASAARVAPAPPVRRSRWSTGRTSPAGR